ncbi:hypothetical protein BDY19DRAFT_901614 [Irpex rosettiformis]|uniref:Uncharacterized protein n=1 Tax=Irpex rosettiformis TaxID=378272 RepID=A0ACB8UJX3_9APHY|nr:hypothetical protein BDY19DRAFT_901614 [Irpex rosettiformis]
MKLPYLLAALCFCNFVVSASIGNRGLNDVFPGFDYPLPPTETRAEEHSPERDYPTHISNIPSAIIPLTSPSATSNSAAKSKETGTQSHQQSTTSSVREGPATNSIIGTIPPLPSFTPWSANVLSSTIANQTPFSPTPTITPLSSEDKGSSHGVQEWKIIGVAVIAFTTVAAILLLSVFFDHWWSFLRDLFWRKKNKDNVEELIPDWERASWAYRLGNDRHRYPTMPPTALSNQADLDLEKMQTFSSEGNVAGIGSGLKGDAYNNSNLKAGYQPNGPWTKGLGLSPLPPTVQYGFRSPTGALGHSLTRQPSRHLDPQRKPPSPALTDPYGGIAE